MALKCCGVSGLRKAHLALWKSLNHKKIKLYLGIKGDVKGGICVKGILKNMAVFNRDTSASYGSSSCILLKTSNPVPEHDVYDFSLKLRYSVGRCTNIVGQRCASWCNHLIVSLLYYKSLINQDPVPDPTPFITRKFHNIRNISYWVHKQNQKTPQETLQYYNNIFDNDDYDQDSEADIHVNVRNLHLPGLE